MTREATATAIMARKDHARSRHRVFRTGADATGPATVGAVSVRRGDRPLRLDDAYVAPARTPADDQNLTQSWCSTSRVVAGEKPVTPGGDDCAFRARAGARYLVFGTKDSSVRLGKG